MNNTALKILSKIIFGLSIAFMALLALPIGIFLMPFMVVWSLTEKVLGYLEDKQGH